MTEAEREGFWARWSRRKRDAAAEAEARPEDAPTEAAPGEGPPPGDAPAGVPGDALEAPAAPSCGACPVPNLPEIDLASLPRIEDLTAESDFSLFLRPGVPSMLRNAALRRMWSLDPSIRDYIGPVEYQWDFNTPGGLPLGFSNELTGDVGKLLAQAIGQLPAEPEPPLSEETPATADAASEAVPEVTPPLPEAIDEPLPALTVEAPAAPPMAQPAADPAPLPRRRHGGALPV